MSQLSLRELDGMFTGSLQQEYESYLKNGELVKSYEGFAGIVGMSRLRAAPPVTPEDQQ